MDCRSMVLEININEMDFIKNGGKTMKKSRNFVCIIVGVDTGNGMQAYNRRRGRRPNRRRRLIAFPRADNWLWEPPAACRP